MTSSSWGSKECSESSAQHGDSLHLYALRSVSFSVAEFAALLVGANETSNPDRLLIWLICLGRLVSDVTEQSSCYVAVQSAEKSDAMKS